MQLALRMQLLRGSQIYSRTVNKLIFLIYNGTFEDNMKKICTSENIHIFNMCVFVCIYIYIYISYINSTKNYER
jgi:hypothetical protein